MLRYTTDRGKDICDYEKQRWKENWMSIKLLNELTNKGRSRRRNEEQKKTERAGMKNEDSNPQPISHIQQLDTGTVISQGLDDGTLPAGVRLVVPQLHP